MIFVNNTPEIRLALQSRKKSPQSLLEVKWREAERLSQPTSITPKASR
jgi:hypothetical protein